MFVERGFSVLGLPWLPKGRLKQLLIREVGEHSTRKQSGNKVKQSIRIAHTSRLTSSPSHQEKVTHPKALTLNVGFKNRPLKTSAEFRSFEHELPILLTWCPAINSALSFTAAWGQWVGSAAWPARGPKFSSVTLFKSSFIRPFCKLFCSRSDDLKVMGGSSIWTLPRGGSRVSYRWSGNIRFFFP